MYCGIRADCALPHHSAAELLGPALTVLALDARFFLPFVLEDDDFLDSPSCWCCRAYSFFHCLQPS